MANSTGSGTNETRIETQRILVEDELVPTTMHAGCGFGAWQPRCLQIFAKPIAFMIVLNIYCVMEGAIASGERIYLATKLIC